MVLNGAIDLIGHKSQNYWSSVTKAMMLLAMKTLIDACQLSCQDFLFYLQTIFKRDESQLLHILETYV